VRQIGETIETISADRTVVLVSHRSWSAGVGRVVTLDHGKLLSPSGPAGQPTAVVR
jgi:ABC-type transport system involved in cytochrome bd biosynthesis fused ATPase/permease subunit